VVLSLEFETLITEYRLLITESRWGAYENI
jgi:hypothetical protein